MLPESLQNLYAGGANFTQKVSVFRVGTYLVLRQYVISFLLVVLTSVACYISTDFIGYRTVALILVMVVSLNAILFDIIPVLLSAILSALIWNYFFIPPIHTWNIETAEDTLMFSMYFVIASINAVLTYKIRQMEEKARHREEKERTIRLYNTLLNSLSHELRTPIATIIGAIDTITANKNRISESNVSELHSEIKIAGFRLNRQVENLLSMGRLESGTLKPKLDWCDINELIYSIIHDNREDSKDHRIYVEPADQLPLFKTDRGFVEQIVQNILYNALCHTPKNSSIRIGVDAIDGYCQIQISDNGIGFPDNEIAQVFDKFYRLSHTATGGIGLGLSIAKGFTEALNGKITLENVPSGGAQFTIRIPAESSSTSELNHE